MCVRVCARLGYSLPSSTLGLALGGNHVTAFLFDLLSARYPQFFSTFTKNHEEKIPARTKASAQPKAKGLEGKEILSLCALHRLSSIAALKEEKCYVAFDYDAEMKKVESKENDIICAHKLVEGKETKDITLDKERFMCGELFFQPSLWKSNPSHQKKSLPDVICGVIDHCDAAVRNELWENIVLVGGASMMKGMEERLRKELVAGFQKSIQRSSSTHSTHQPRLRVVVPSANDDRSLTSWQGGALLAASTFANNKLWIKFVV